jgi:hypothetical protein
VPTRGGNLQSPFDVFLPLDVAEVGLNDHGHLVHLDMSLGGDELRPNQVAIKLTHALNGNDLQVGEKRGFRGVFGWHKNTLKTLPPGDGGHR